MVDKLLVTSRSGLAAKYQGHLGQLLAAIDARIQADSVAGIDTRLEFLDDGSGELGALAAKGAVDALFSQYQPDYLVILGAQDVVPHQDLANTARSQDDPDEVAFSDLPYACDSPYSQRITDFLSPSRVVGRLPDLVGDHDPAYLIWLLEQSTVPQPRDAYVDYFGLSAATWAVSTRLSSTAVFGTDDSVWSSPPSSPPWDTIVLGRRAHLINCHGALQRSEFFGQDGQSFPVAISSSDAEKAVNPGTVAAAECCYGAALYDRHLADGNLPIANAYLSRGAAAFLGSTTIAFGPSRTTDWADLMCQFWLNAVLAGASVGRALLDARQAYVERQGPLDPNDLKTLAQFLILGDPAATPIQSPEPKSGRGGQAAVRETRAARRSDARERAMALEMTTAFAAEEVDRRLDLKSTAGGAIPTGYHHRAFAVQRSEIRKSILLATQNADIYFHLYSTRADPDLQGVIGIQGILATEVSGTIVEQSDFVSR